ncbi:TPA: PTS sugar transporter subunit IIA [Clostridium sporogenes]
MFNLFRNRNLDNNLYSPVDGYCIDLDKVEDKVFASKMMGDGVAFVLENDTILSPCDGKIVMIAETKHAIGIMADNGVEILIHVGLDTVNLAGKGFDLLTKQDSVVKRGNPILKVDRSLMKENNINLITPMIITNSKKFKLIKPSLEKKVSASDSVVILLES